jgi:hypothetical protein
VQPAEWHFSKKMPARRKISLKFRGGQIQKSRIFELFSLDSPLSKNTEKR